MTDSLRSLLDKATPRPWSADVRGKIATVLVGDDWGGAGYSTRPEDAALIVALVNCAEELLAVVEAARAFHERFWNPWRSGRSSAMTSDEVADAYGELRATLAALDDPGEET